MKLTEINSKFHDSLYSTFFLNTPILLGFSIVTLVYSVFVLYLIFGVVRGVYSYVPWVTDIIKANLRGQV